MQSQLLKFTQKVGVNYHNLGNTCFMDAALNTYASDPNVIHIDCKCRNCGRDKFCALRCIHDTLEQQQASKRKLKPVALHKNIKKINADYDEKENDGHFCGAEFLSSILDKVKDTFSSQILDKVQDTLSVQKPTIQPSFIL